MIVRALDVNGDWQFGKGRNDYKSNLDAVIQNISTRLKSFLGDCFFAADAGIDWFNLLGSKNQLALELAVRATILNTQNVLGIVSSSVNVNSSTRLITITYIVNTIYLNNTVNVPIQSTTSLLLTEDGDVLVTESGSGIIAG